jgi:hypothetical protein
MDYQKVEIYEILVHIKSFKAVLIALSDNGATAANHLK